MKDFMRRISNLSPKRLALLVVELQSKLEKLERKNREPIAIIGAGCRFPGGANDLESFWKLLHNGVDAINEIPAHRWKVDNYFDRDVHAPGKISTRWAGLIDRIDQFDAKFFGIAPREAITMDPQQRILLEVTWESLERAGLSPDRLVGTKTGVFIGISGSDYYHLQLEEGMSGIDAYFASGNAHSVASGRLSYILGLQGPCLSVDTACSSSLVAIHLSVQSLRNMECQVAIAGGANLILSPEITIALSKAELMASDGRCKAFDARANGFVRGEGCGVLVLKRLSDAIKDRDNILAIISGSAINQDGRSNGLTAPNGPSQEDVIKLALSNSGVAPEQISYIETHGTGTSLGDPIEARALGAVMCQERTKEDPLIIGSVKTNIGHLEAAAGVAGLIKVILALHNEEIPSHLHFETPNPHIEWKRLPITVSSKPRKWPAGEKTRIAGVSSFGFSGTNAHLIIEEAPAITFADPAEDRPFHLLSLSAKSEKVLKTLANRYADDMAVSQSRALADVCFTANTGRAQFNHRLAVVAKSTDQVKQSLEAFAKGEITPDMATGRYEKKNAPVVAFIFTGQGSQYIGMGRELYETQPTFRKNIDRCDEILRPLLSKPLFSILYPKEEKLPGSGTLLNQTEFTQPALFALEYALAELWRSWGIEPAMVMGHSVGEYVAACVAGVFSLEDGLKLISERARLMQDLPSGGTMAAIFIDHQHIDKFIEPYRDSISIAAYNGTENTVISGVEKDVKTVLKELGTRGISYRQLNVSHAFHSALIEPMLMEFKKKASEISYKSATIDIVSNVTGKLAGTQELSNSTYWYRHTLEAVRFSESIQTLHRQGCNILLEIGPNPVLSAMAGRILPQDNVSFLYSLRKGQSELRQMLKSLAALYTCGATVNWAGFDQDWPRRKVVLPTYPFQRKRYWSGKVASPKLDQDQQADEDWREWLFEFDWESKPLDDKRFSSPDYIPGTDKIIAEILPELKQLILRYGVDVYDEFLPHLDNLCSAFILEAFKQIGFNFQKDDRFTTQTIMDRFGIIDQHQRLLNRIFAILAEDGILNRDEAEWVVTKTNKSINPELLRNELIERYPTCSAELNMIGSCAGKIAEVLQGKCDPMQLLFPNGSLELTESMYQNAPVLRVFNSLIRNVFVSVVEKLPLGRKIRILEIGAGTGGTTGFLLPKLPASQTEYIFTDISEVFLNRAKQKFRNYNFLEYHQLNIDQDLQAQGYDLHRFDIILAANVLHATPDLRKTLTNVKRLLADEGLLILLEGTAYQRFSDLTVGLTKGWWHFTDEDLRPSYALLSKKKWYKLLETMGFNYPVAIPMDRTANGSVLSQQAVIIARGPKTEDITIASKGTDNLSPWLIFADNNGIGRQFQKELSSKGEHCIVAVKGDDFKKVDNNMFVLDPLKPEHYKRFVESVLNTGQHKFKRIVHFWGTDEEVTANTSLSNLDNIQHMACGSVLYLIQAMAGYEIEPSPCLTLVTRGSQAIGRKEILPGIAQATLWGLGRVIAQEHPELNCIRIDLDPKRNDHDILALTKEVLTKNSKETQVALRNGERFVLRLQKSFTQSKTIEFSTESFRSDAAYLITGGLSGLGLVVARWMVDHGARKLALMGRHGPSEQAQSVISGMREMGAEITIARGDVAIRKEIRTVIDRIAADKKPLRGIIHCAGTLDDGILLQQSWDRFRKVMKAKISGSWNLHCLTMDKVLDFFVLFSSGASLLGSSGQGNHAAANAFMDALAHHRRALDLPGLSINWGAWSKVGAAAKNNIARRVQTKGMGLIHPEKGLTVLGHLLQTNPVQVGVLPIRWSDFFQEIGVGDGNKLFERLLQQVKEKTIVNETREMEPEMAKQLQNYSPSKRYNFLFRKIQNEAIKSLGLDKGDLIDPSQPLSELGLDSLMAVELRNCISLMVGKPLSATLLFNYPSLDELVRYLSDEILSLQNDETVQLQNMKNGRQYEANEEELEKYSEDEMANLLEEKLKSI